MIQITAQGKLTYKNDLNPHGSNLNKALFVHQHFGRGRWVGWLVGWTCKLTKPLGATKSWQLSKTRGTNILSSDDQRFSLQSWELVIFYQCTMAQALKKSEIKDFCQKILPLLPFSQARIISDENIWMLSPLQFHFKFYIWVWVETDFCGG